jgi:sugar transferase EpsL
MYRFIKRCTDLIGALTLLVLLTPLFLLVWFVIAVTLGPPVIFRQTRPGYKGRAFVIYKFRTMADGRDAQGESLPDAQRLGGIGKLIRDLSLDELPQLWNVIRGDLSFVGPRPLLVEYLPLYNQEQARRHEVKPGITGLAQVNGRNAVSWDERFAHDIWYVNHCSIWLDFKIVLKTVGNVLLRRGISQAGSVTMEKFRGNRD